MMIGDVWTFDDFNSHAHVERDEFDNDNNASYLNFNSHAHVERDGQWRNSGKGRFISTHTLTWSVTSTLVLEVWAFPISTHTLTWSVTYAETAH